MHEVQTVGTYNQFLQLARGAVANNAYNNKKYTFNVHGSVHRENIPIYIQQDATFHSSLYLETAQHVLDGTPTHHQEHIQLYLQHLVFVTSLLLPATIMEELERVPTPNM
jgi:hypothetical protein